MVSSTMGIFLHLVFSLGLTVLTESANILLLPYPYPSVVKSFTCLGNRLTDHGHSTYIALPSTFRDMAGLKKRKKFEVIEFSGVHPDSIVTYTKPHDDQSVTPNEREILREDAGVDSCYNLLESEDLNNKVKDLNIQLVIVNAFLSTLCYTIFPYRLDIPFISMVTLPDPWFLRSPALPSFVPYSMHPSLTPNMTFWERLLNTWIQIDWVARYQELNSGRDELITKYAPNKPPISMNTLLGRSVLWFIETDPVIDYARPIMPNEIEIAGLTTSPASPLPQEIQEFIESANEGVILAAFGTLSTLTEKHLMQIMKVFEMVSKDVHIIMKSPVYDKTINLKALDNIMITDWLPQNDILGHPNTKLFITHCGAYGQHEALYHGVPMLGLPLFWDQHYNCHKVVYKGFGEMLEFSHFTTARFHALIEKMLATNTYSDEIKRASEIFRSRKVHPTEKAAAWVDHVIEFGASHLRSHALDMPWYEFIMLDILMFVMVIILIFCVAIYGICLHGYRMFHMEQKEKAV